MIECASCRTLNPDAARSCLACGLPLGATRAPAPAKTGVAPRCPQGHPVDPDWPSCPYCDRDPSRRDSRPASGPTRLDLGATTPLAPAAAGAPTRLEPRSAAAGRTVLQEAPRAAAAGEPPPAGLQGGRAARLVAVLAAPDLGAGTIFPVRAGKTLIGTDRRSDVAIAGDSQVSAEHAVLLYRDGVFQLTDRLSTNGTFINGLEVPANGTVALRDRDQLLVGDTRLVLLIIDKAS